MDNYVFGAENSAPQTTSVAVSVNDGRSLAFEGLRAYSDLIDSLRNEGLRSFSVNVNGSPVVPEMLSQPLPPGAATASVTLKNAHGC